MNTLTVLCLVVAVAFTSGQLVAYPGMYGYPGVYGTYPGLLPHAAPITLKAGTPSTITLKTVAAAPIAYKAVTPTKAVSPVIYNVAPVAPVAQVAPVAPLAPVHSKFHAQDELGQYSFGYSGGPSSRAETRDAFGIVRGSFNYVDTKGKVQTQHYVADGLGFRVSGTNLPAAPEAPEALALVGPEPVEDTPEVAAAKLNFKSLLEKAAATPESGSESVAESESKAASETVSESISEDTAVTRKKRSAFVPAAFPYASPLHFSYGYSAPLTYSHPAVAYSAAFPAITAYSGIPTTTTYSAAPAALHDANLLRVVHNPGHAVSYRVD